MPTGPAQPKQPEPAAESAAKRWLEPLYDFVLGITIGQLTGVFTEAVTLASFIRFCWLFIPAWWIWNGFSLYFDRFDRDAWFQRTVLLVSMLPVLLFSVTAPQTFQAKIPGFTWSYVAARALLLLLFIYSWRTDAQGRPAAVGLLRGYALGLLCWVIGGVWTEYGIAWKVLGLAIDFATPWLNRQSLAKQAVSQEHFTKRLQAFTLIVVGQNVKVQPQKLGMMLWKFPALLTGVNGFLLTAGVWWWYYAHYEKLFKTTKQPTGLRFSFGHLFLFLGTGTLSLGVFDALNRGHASWLLPLGLTLYVGALLGMSYALILPQQRRRYAQCTAALVAVAWLIAWLPVLDWMRLLLTNGAALAYLFLTYPALVPLTQSAEQAASSAAVNR